MRIPVYKSQARATSEAPGARMTARMSAQPFVNQAIQKGEVLTSAITQVGEYANTRYKMLVETQKNESIFAAKEALMGLSRDLERSADVGNIFDGEQKYEQGVNAVFNEMRAKAGKNKYALQDFENSFRQMEIPIKFRLKDIVDSKIIARRQAALKALEDQQVAVLSDPYLNYTADDVALSQVGVQVAHDQAVKNGGVNPVTLGNVSQRIAGKALENLIPAYAGTDLDAAVQLTNVLDEINKVRAGGDPADMKIGNVPPHVLNMLQAVPPEDAAAVVQSTLKMATTFFNAQEKIEEQVDKDVADINGRAYNAILSIEGYDLVPQSTLQSLIPPNIYDQLPDIVTSKENLNGVEVKSILAESLKGQFWASPAQVEKIDGALQSQGGFAPRGDAATYSQLYGMAESGMLSTEELNSQKFLLTAQQHRELTTKLFNEADESLSVGSTLLSRSFRYNAQQAVGKDDRLAQASKTAFESADFALRDEFARRELEGNPMTLSEVRQFANAKIEEFGVIYREELRAEYLEFIADYEADILGLTINPSDPLGSIDAWYNSLDADQQETQKSKRNIFKSLVKSRFGGQELF